MLLDRGSRDKAALIRKEGSCGQSEFEREKSEAEDNEMAGGDWFLRDGTSKDREVWSGGIVSG